MKHVIISILPGQLNVQSQNLSGCYSLRIRLAITNSSRAALLSYLKGSQGLRVLIADPEDPQAQLEASTWKAHNCV